MSRLFFAFFVLTISAFSYAQEPIQPQVAEATESKERQQLRAHEPNRFGYVNDGNDVPHIGIQLSIEWSPIPFYIPVLCEQSDKCVEPALAFTTRQAFYWGQRESSPVIGQEYNPELFLRWNSNRFGEIAFGYNHQSNGQSIETERAYLDRQLSEKDPSHAKEYISRGWDFWELSQKGEFYEIDYVLTGRYFLSQGVLQDGAEQVNNWETDLPLLDRAEVDGLSLRLERIFDTEKCQRTACLRNISYEHTTGIDDPFDQNSSIFEVGINSKRIKGGTLILWASSGYNSDLVDYYRKVSSWGIAVEIGNFLSAN